MKRFELGMSLDYVSHWGVEDAIREFFQNCFDAAQENPDNAWYVDYNPELKTVRIGNKKGSITTGTLLLGKTTKKDKENQIGKFGEGYKVGTVVLLRNGCSVTVYNYEKKEIWRAKTIKSRRYGDVVPVFDIESDSIFNPIKGNDLIFELSGIEPEVWSKVVERNLFLQDDIGEHFDTKDGKVLLDEKYKGKVYVSGLYVCEKEQLAYGYDLSPKVVKLDRDRGLVDSYNLQYVVGKVIALTGNADLIKNSLKLWDGRMSYIYNIYDGRYDGVSNSIARDFYKNWGADAVPVASMDEFNLRKRMGDNVVLVSEGECQYIQNSELYEQEDVYGRLSPEDALLGWYQIVCKEHLSETEYNKGLALINAVINREV